MSELDRDNVGDSPPELPIRLCTGAAVEFECDVERLLGLRWEGPCGFGGTTKVEDVDVVRGILGGSEEVLDGWGIDGRRKDVLVGPEGELFAEPLLLPRRERLEG